MSRIVIIDDRSTNRNIFSKLAASIEPEVTVQTFGDPLDALAWLAGNLPDLVITDYKMPNMDGAEFIRRFRDIPGAEDIPVIVITVYEERTFRLRALESGATDFLHSPVDHHEFVTRARNLLKMHKHQLLLAARASTLAEELEQSERAVARFLRASRAGDRHAADHDHRDRRPTGASCSPTSASSRSSASEQDVVGRKMAERVRQRNVGPQHRARPARVRKPLGAGAFEEELTDAKGVTRIFLTAKSPIMDQANTVSARADEFARHHGAEAHRGAPAPSRPSRSADGTAQPHAAARAHAPAGGARAARRSYLRAAHARSRRLQGRQRSSRPFCRRPLHQGDFPAAARPRSATRTRSRDWAATSSRSSRRACRAARTRPNSRGAFSISWRSPTSSRARPCAPPPPSASPFIPATARIARKCSRTPTSPCTGRRRSTATASASSPPT